MHIENEFLVHAAPGDVFGLLVDIDEVVGCIPGAELTSRGANDLKGRVRLKLGPLILNFEGDAVIERSDHDALELALAGSGRDRQGRGSVDVTVVARVSETDNGMSNVRVEQDLRVVGKIAQFSHGVMKDVSERLALEFAQCLEAKLSVLASPESSTREATEVPAPVSNGRSSLEATSPEPISGLRLAYWAIKRAVVRWLRRLLGRVRSWAERR